jgi:hypothetical protein
MSVSEYHLWMQQPVREQVRVVWVFIFLLTFCMAGVQYAGAAAAEDPARPAGREVASRFAALALECVHKEYPNKISHVMSGDADARAPRDLTPVFFGCFDWHSSVHGHWMLARLARLYPDAGFASAARVALGQSFHPGKIITELAYLRGKGRTTFERPYGLAWLLQLAAELREWDLPQARAWSASLVPLEKEARNRIASWLPKLTYAIRVGEHSQTAFAFGLILDWARVAGDREMEELLTSRIRDLYLKDVNCPLAYEPSGQDFLSPCIAEADLMRRVLKPEAYSKWLAAFLPDIPREGGAGWLPLAIVSDPGDGKLAHLDGLNLSRAWMLEGIAGGLRARDRRLPAILAAAEAHLKSGTAAVTGSHYEGGHWLGSFATYLVTKRGIPSREKARLYAP